MTTVKNNIQLPYLEDTGLDGKKTVYTERMDGATTTLYQTNLWYRHKTGIIWGNKTNKQQMDGKRTGNKTRSYLGSRTMGYRKHN